MTVNPTLNDLVRFLYRETSARESVYIVESLKSDVVLNESFQMMRRSYRRLPKVTFSPSAKTLQNIMKYSETSALEVQL